MHSYCKCPFKHCTSLLHDCAQHTIQATQPGLTGASQQVWHRSAQRQASQAREAREAAGGQLIPALCVGVSLPHTAA